MSDASGGRDLERTVDLIRRARSGESSALEEVYARYLPRLRRWASGRIPGGARHLQDTGDVVQDVLQHFLTKVRDFEPRHDGALMAYLRTAVMNRIRDMARSVKRRPDQVEIDDHDAVSREPSPYEQCVAREVRRRYEAALMRLSEEQRAAVILKLELDLGPRQIARALDRPTPDAARMFTERAIRKLAEVMADV